MKPQNTKRKESIRQLGLRTLSAAQSCWTKQSAFQRANIFIVFSGLSQRKATFYLLAKVSALVSLR